MINPQIFWPTLHKHKLTVITVGFRQGMALICMARPVEDCVIETQSDWGYSLGVGEWKGPTGHILGKEVRPSCSAASMRRALFRCRSALHDSCTQVDQI
jgi:hypothetical protein